MLNTARQVGGAIGVALLGSLVAHRGAFLAGLHAGLGLVAAAFAAGALVAARYVERTAGGRRTVEPSQEAA